MGKFAEVLPDTLQFLWNIVNASFWLTKDSQNEDWAGSSSERSSRHLASVLVSWSPEPAIHPHPKWNQIGWLIWKEDTYHHRTPLVRLRFFFFLSMLLSSTTLLCAEFVTMLDIRSTSVDSFVSRDWTMWSATMMLLWVSATMTRKHECNADLFNLNILSRWRFFLSLWRCNSCRSMPGYCLVLLLRYSDRHMVKFYGSLSVSSVFSEVIPSPRRQLEWSHILSEKKKPEKVQERSFWKTDIPLAVKSLQIQSFCAKKKNKNKNKTKPTACQTNSSQFQVSEVFLCVTYAVRLYKFSNCAV